MHPPQATSHSRSMRLHSLHNSSSNGLAPGSVVSQRTVRSPTAANRSRLVRAAMSQKQQPQQQMKQPASHTPTGSTSQQSPHTWTKHMSLCFNSSRRNWAAVESFYLQLVAGQQCLASLGLSPAGQPAAGMDQEQLQQLHPSEQQQCQQAQYEQQCQQQQEQQERLAASRKAHRDSKRVGGVSRTTYKLHVSYLGGSFSGWLRGNTHSKPAVQHSLGCAIAATGLTAKADTGGSRKAKRAVSRAARKAYTLELAAGGDEAVAAAAAAAVHAEAAEDSAAALQLQQPGCQVPFLLCAGRTDAGVSACAQVASFFSWQPAVAPEQLVDIINTHLQEQWTAGWADAASGTAADSYTSSSPSSNSPGSRSSSRNSCTEAAAELRDSHSGSQQASEVQPPMCPLRVWQAEIVPRQFHPTFAASWRRYVYLWPLQEVPTAQPSPQEYQPRFTSELRQPTDLTPEQLQAVQAAPDVDPALANAMLQRLQGRRVNYYAFARDTPQGKDCECTLLVARACLVQLPAVSGAAGTGTSTCCLAVELVGDRFLRRMVRVLVGTLVREVVAGSGEDALLVLAQSLERPATAGPAPALGLCFAGVGFS